MLYIRNIKEIGELHESIFSRTTCKRLVSRLCNSNYCRRHAERKARVSSDDFKKCQEIVITEIDMNEEQCVLIANTGA